MRHPEPDDTSTEASAAAPSGSVGNALRILLMFRDSTAVRVSDVARELGVARSTAHRLLTTLERYRFATQQVRGKAYEAGPALLDMGLHALADLDLRSVARSHLEHLCRMTSESTGLLVLEGRDVVVLDFVPGSHRLRVVERLGDRAPAHSTAAGKAILAALNPNDIRRLYPGESLPASAPRSVHTRRALEEELERIRHDGYALNREESGQGSVGIAAAVVHRIDGVVGAVSLALPTSRLNDDLGADFGAFVVETAHRIGEGLP
ncbi:IclR family transcriptional regulator (plasmid) [Rhodococcus pyridinivorans]|uniref:IclR family transcriptional regulator n=1 Tax=Rhodococcus pyridinivorans TaxID=103816 RepID=UPI0020C5B890|nr:IclR family transcriptional regulator [Rhodococcus pyridinivorans]UTM39797.1 IclR family transcriptional regulator [Rhodococcus pyridinivorans]